MDLFLVYNIYYVVDLFLVYLHSCLHRHLLFDCIPSTPLHSNFNSKISRSCLHITNIKFNSKMNNKTYTCRCPLQWCQIDLQLWYSISNCGDKMSKMWHRRTNARLHCNSSPNYRVSRFIVHVYNRRISYVLWYWNLARPFTSFWQPYSKDYNRYDKSVE